MRQPSIRAGLDLVDAIGRLSLAVDRRRLQRAIAERSEEAEKPVATAEEPARTRRVAEAERRHMTVLFCDLVASTELAGRLDPEDLAVVIGGYHTCCAEVVGRWDGHIARYLGDGVLVYFGYPKAHEDDAERAVRTGLDLIAAVGRLRTLDGAPLRARVGIATGLVMVGELSARAPRRRRPWSARRPISRPACRPSPSRTPW